MKFYVVETIHAGQSQSWSNSRVESNYKKALKEFHAERKQPTAFKSKVTLVVLKDLPTKQLVRRCLSGNEYADTTAIVDLWSASLGRLIQDGKITDRGRENQNELFKDEEIPELGIEGVA